ncbi:hypothetical protein GGD64_002110 [Bradyrhizobium sp. CIR3A]|nr:hypothetical protein [Bradyrhizobium sp. CIR3A]
MALEAGPTSEWLTRMVRRPTGARRLRNLKAHLGQTERSDKYVDHANRVALANQVIEAFGQQCPLPTICLFVKSLINSKITRDS